MADSATTRYGARKQSLGSNTNTWGDTKLNVDLDIFDRGSKGYQSLTVTGDATLTWTIYTSTNDGQVATLRLGGTPSAAFTLTFPSTEWELDLINASGQTGTMKCSGGTGIAIPTGRTSRLYCDGTDIYSKTPNYLPTATTLTNDQDLVSKAQLGTAIAAASGLTAPFILETAADTTAGYHGAKHTVQVGSVATTQLSGLLSVQYSTQNPAGAEKHLLTYSAGYVGGFLDGGLKTAAFTPVVGSGYDVDCSSAGFTVQLSSMTTPQLGQEIKLNKFGNNSMLLLGTINGATNLAVSVPTNYVYRYCGSSWGWN